MRSVRQSLDADHIEANRMAAPLRLAPHQVLGGADDLALLAPVHRGQRAAEVDAAPLAHLDDGKYLTVEAHQIQLTGRAAKVARDHHETLRFQIRSRELL